MTIGIIGLGNMGLPIATRMLGEGFSVIGYNRSVERRKLFEASGGKTAGSMKEIAALSDLILLVLSNDEATHAVVTEILTEMKPGSIILSLSTISPETASTANLLCNKKAIAFVSCPVLGRPPVAAAGQLFLLLSGNLDAKQRVQPVLNAIGQKVFDFGDDPATAKSVKLIMNYMIFVITSMLSEVMIAAERLGIPKNILLETMLGTIFGAPIIKNYGNLIIEEKQNPNGFTTTLANKDLTLMIDQMARFNMSLPLGEVVHHHFATMIKEGQGNEDLTLMVTHLREALSKPSA